jgi:selenocysteine lyase/cysteine desulfurase
MIYLDNGATTFPKPECVYIETDRFAREGAVNAGRGAYKAARRATEMIREVKTGLLSLVDARGQAEVALTPSVTIALNQIIQVQKWQEGMTAYVTPYEHNAVIRPLKLMEQKHHILVKELPLKEDLSIDLEGVRAAFAECPPDFVAVTAISNVTGYVLPATEIFAEAKKYGAFTVLDAAQAMGLLQMRFAQMKADCIAFAGHKTLYAPFGVAGFLIKNGVDLELLLECKQRNQVVKSFHSFASEYKFVVFEKVDSMLIYIDLQGCVEWMGGQFVMI